MEQKIKKKIDLKPFLIEALSIKRELIKDMDRYEGLGAKWKVDPAELTKKIEPLTEFECYVIAKLVDEFWGDQSKNN